MGVLTGGDRPYQIRITYSLPSEKYKILTELGETRQTPTFVISQTPNYLALPKIVQESMIGGITNVQVQS